MDATHGRRFTAATPGGGSLGQPTYSVSVREGALTNPYFTFSSSDQERLKLIQQQWAEQKPLFPGAEILAEVLGGIALTLSTGGFGKVLTPVIRTAVSTGIKASQSGGSMALNIGGLVGGIGTILSGSSLPVFQGLGTIASAFSGAFQPQAIAPQPQQTYTPRPATFAPVYSPLRSPEQMPAIRTMAAGSVVGYTARMLGSVVGPILVKIWGTIGKRVTLPAAISMIRRMGKFFISPAAIAVALGITVEELAQLITAHSGRTRRHMNPANPKALRRAARRIKGFHRMASHIDLLKTRGRRATSRCGTCRKNPCRC